MTEPTNTPPLTDEQKAERKAVSKAITEVASHIADDLGETEAQPRATIWRSVKALGSEQAQALLSRAQEIEAAGGMLTADNTHRRTLGGVYFALARQTANGKDRFFIFGPPKSAHATPTGTSQQTVAPPAAPAPPFVWADRLNLFHEIGTDAGEGTTVKVTLIGRPGKPVIGDQFTTISMPSMKTPALPKGLPTPPDAQTQHLVYINAKQWRKVAEAAADPDDALIIEGWAVYDPDLPGLSVFATNTTSKKLQAATREQPEKQYFVVMSSLILLTERVVLVSRKEKAIKPLDTGTCCWHNRCEGSRNRFQII